MPVYLDCNATTPLEPAVADVVRRFMERDYGNAASPIHDFGTFARMAVEHARGQVAALVAAARDEVIFTSGATEADNLAIIGLAELGLRQGRRHVISTAIEHKSVLEPLAELTRRGLKVDFMPAASDGRSDVDMLRRKLRPDTLLVSTMHVNNETGVVQPLEEIASLLDGHDAWWHVDAAQGYGKDLAPLKHRRIDLIAASAHKLYGPKGVGVLICRKRDGRLPPLRPLMHGGGQEQGLRPGTLPVPLIAGFGEAAKLAGRDHSIRAAACSEFGVKARQALDQLDAKTNGSDAHRMPHVMNVSIPGVPADRAIQALKEIIAVSSTSACTSHLREPSHVLRAMGITADQVETSLRLSWCHLTPEVDWDTVVTVLKKQRK